MSAHDPTAAGTDTPAVLPAGVAAVVFDVGETLVDESGDWAAHAAAAGVSPFTLMGAVGALISQGRDHRAVWSLLGVDRPQLTRPIGAADLYLDALECLQAAYARGLVVGIAGNQPAGVDQQLHGLGFAADFIASSSTWGVAKPSPVFFDRICDAAGVAASRILYVGDRPDNDILPARAAGMRTAFLRRGPWGHLHATDPAVHVADLQLESLTDLTAALRRPC